MDQAQPGPNLLLIGELTFVLNDENDIYHFCGQLSGTAFEAIKFTATDVTRTLVLKSMTMTRLELFGVSLDRTHLLAYDTTN
jgi:hypothetical protein